MSSPAVVNTARTVNVPQTSHTLTVPAQTSRALVRPQPPSAPHAAYAAPRAALSQGAGPQVGAPAPSMPRVVRGADAIGDKLTKDYLKEMALRLAPKVRAATGWPLDISGLCWEIFSTKQVACAQLDSVKDRTGVSPAVWKKNVVECKRSLIPADCINGIYRSDTQQMMLVRDNARQLNEDSLSVVLIGLLVQAAQQQRYPHYYSALAKVEKAYLENVAAHGYDNDATQDLQDTLRAREAWMRGQMRAIQESTMQYGFPNARQMLGLGGLLRGYLSEIGYRALYVEDDGRRVYDALAHANVAYVNACFAEPRWVDALLRRSGTVKIEVPAVCAAQAQGTLATLLHIAPNAKASVQIVALAAKPARVVQRPPAPSAVRRNQG